MFSTNVTTRFAARFTTVAALVALSAGAASATRVSYGDRPLCTYYDVCEEVCEEPDQYGQVYCSYACDSYLYCVNGGAEELPSSEEVCEFDDDGFFSCYLQ